MQPFGSGIAAENPKTASRNVNGNFLRTIRGNEIEDHIRAEADANHRRPERRIIAVRRDAERRDVFVDHRVLGEALDQAVAMNAPGEFAQPVGEIANPFGRAAGGAVAESVLLHAAAPVVFPRAVLEGGEERTLIFGRDVIGQQSEAGDGRRGRRFGGEEVCLQHG